MILSTGFHSDFAYYDPSFSDFDRWEDAGGVDVLMLPDFTSMPDQMITYDGSALSVGYGSLTLTIPDNVPGTPSMEFLEYRAHAYTEEDAPVSLGTLRLITDLAGTTAGHVAMIGSDEDEVITAPVDPQPVTGFSVIFGNGGNDQITLSPTQEVRAFGGAGRDVIRGKSADDFISGGNGRDTLAGRAGQDEIFGGRGKDVLRGGAGDDWLYGDSFVFLPMKGFDDRIFGGRGDDNIVGGGGTDVMTGGAGADSFHFMVGRTDGAVDRITDFDADRDRLLIDTDTRPGVIRVKAQGDDTLVRFVTDYYGETIRYDIVLLEGVTLSKSEIDFDW
ncbi:hypothetical protein [Aquicoccus sp. SU-CL01552]|uniref:calcium-binding protein n=1 Tax=Aquicoccus sp. SU-CL01552 TaxID=3127656 RepID=UPI00310B72E9